MAITTLQQLTDAVVQSRRKVIHGHTSTGNSGTVNSQWTSAGRFPQAAGAVPATGAGAACDRTTTGAVIVPGAAPGGANKIYLVRWLTHWAAGKSRAPILMDRLVHTSGLSGTVITAQTVNSAALPTRGGTGEYVEAALEWYTATGATPTTATIVYVDDTGTSRTSVVDVPASPAVGHMQFIPHVNGVQHRGIQSVTSVTLAASTGTAGNFGVTLFRRLASGRMRIEQDPLDWRIIGIPKVDYQACLFVAHGIDNTGVINSFNELVFAEA